MQGRHYGETAVKKSALRTSSEQMPFGHTECVNLDSMTDQSLDYFELWSMIVRMVFLSFRKKRTERSFDELAAM